MRFAHLADIHLGGWRQPELNQLNLEAFRKAIDKCIQEKVDFVLIAGDFFDIAMPPIEILKEAAEKLKILKENNIGCFIISGSHDYSVSGKTFLDVLQAAGLCENVHSLDEEKKELGVRVNDKYGIELCGMPGKKAALEISVLKNLTAKRKTEKHFGIFMLHTTVSEAKPEGLDFMESISLKEVPQGFDYYAAGHLHQVTEIKHGNSLFVYPGPLFPNNFEELEKLGEGSFYIVDFDTSGKAPLIKTRKESIKLKEVEKIYVNFEEASPEDATKKVLSEIGKRKIEDKIVLLRIVGKLRTGKAGDIDLRAIENSLSLAYISLRSTSGIESTELELKEEVHSKDIEGIESELISTYVKTSPDFQDFSKKIHDIMHALDTEKKDGETNDMFENKLYGDFGKIIDLRD
jgi:hypothetical protein